jgi:two-component system response regulator CpxR
MNKILIIDDDIEFCELLAEYLSPEGFQTDFSTDWEEGLKKVSGGGYSLVILDVMLPKSSGFQVLDSIHNLSEVPVLMLTARNDATDRIVGLEKGADDYLFKPVNPRELIARIRSIIRRVSDGPGLKSSISAPPTAVKVDDVELDSASRRVVRGGDNVELTSVEFSILETLLRNAGKVVTRESISKTAMGKQLSSLDRSIEVHISHIRKKLGAAKDGSERIKTVRNEGYQYVLNSSGGAIRKL